MKKISLLFKLVLLCLTVNGQPEAKTVKKILLQEDDKVKITLFCFSKADIGDADWLKIEIVNKTDHEIVIDGANYYLNREKVLENGEVYIDIGTFGRGTKYDLIHYFFDLPNLSDFRDSAIIKPHDSIFAWTFLTNYAGVLLDGRKITGEEICALFYLDFQYKIKQEAFQLVVDNIPFCFDWEQSDLVAAEKLESRLRGVILNPHYRWVNSYMVTKLMAKENIVRRIPTEVLIEGVVLREKTMVADENILLLKE